VRLPHPHRGRRPGVADPAAGAGAPEAGGDDARGERFAIAVARFYEELADRLVAGATGAFAEHGAEVELHDVPGAFELPLAARWCAETGRYDGVACLGAVIRGETDHYDYVCSEAARGIQQVQLDTGVPCAFGVLTVDTMEQALARSGGGTRDTGRDAAEVVLRMAALRQELHALVEGAAAPEW
jgi:6,7-dimethyl-8-ribityllumazine synthase